MIAYWKRITGILSLTGAGIIVAAVPLSAQQESQVDPEEAFRQAITYEFGDDNRMLRFLEEHIRGLAEEVKAQNEWANRMADLLLMDEATVDAKRFASRQLTQIGTAESVPALAGLLSDPELSDMARYALEQIEAEAAGKALREAIGGGRLEGDLLLGAIHSLGERGEPPAPESLLGLLGDRDESIASASAIALGKIGGSRAVSALEAALASATPAVRRVVADAYLRAADSLLAAGDEDEAIVIYTRMYEGDETYPVRAAALQGLVRSDPDGSVPLLVNLLQSEDYRDIALAARYARQVNSAEAPARFGELLSRLSAPAQVLVLEALAARGDPAALASVAAVAGSEIPEVRLAALRALGSIGDASVISRLAKIAASGTGAEQGAARAALAQLRGVGVDVALASAFEIAQAPYRVELITAISARKPDFTIDVLRKGALDNDTAVRLESLRRLSSLAGREELPFLVARVLEAEEASVRGAAVRAFEVTSLRLDEEKESVEVVLSVLDSANIASTAAFLRILGRLGGDQALAAIRSANKHSSPEVRDAALRALADWPDAAVLEDLLTLAKDAEDLTHRVVALRGYLRVLGLPSNRTISATLAWYEHGLEVALRAEDKRMVLASLPPAGALAALKMVEPYLAEEAVREEAAVAAINIAASMDPAQLKEAEAIFRTVKEVSRNEGIRAEAEAILQKIRA